MSSWCPDISVGKWSALKAVVHRGTSTEEHTQTCLMAPEVSAGTVELRLLQYLLASSPRSGWLISLLPFQRGQRESRGPTGSLVDKGPA